MCAPALLYEWPLFVALMSYTEAESDFLNQPTVSLGEKLNFQQCMNWCELVKVNLRLHRRLSDSDQTIMPPGNNKPAYLCLFCDAFFFSEANKDTVPTFPEGATPTPVATVSQYACQRRTSTENYNKIFTLFSVGSPTSFHGSVLHVQREGLLCEHDSKALAVMSNGGGSVPYCPTSVNSAEQNDDCKHIRYHSNTTTRSIKEIDFRQRQLLPAHDLAGHIDNMIQSSFVLDVQVAVPGSKGFLHYKDISRAVSKAEARALGNIIDEAVHAITPDAVLALTGGFRRGKEFGHDVDFLVTTPELGREKSLLPDIIDRLKQDGILLYCDYQASTFDISKLPSLRFEAMDLFAKCFLILRLKGSKVEGGLNSAAEDHRGWRAVRVDLVSPPMDRYAYALLGWTGSRTVDLSPPQQFERDLRRFARFERQMRLDNHILYDKTKNEFLAATTEKDIFDHLGLEYIEPWQRNA
ncbi:hypothetical protein F2P81_019939 [Scophthalmus maximus]|uniref:DNA-directed DNA polymerase X domain-containing protein n=1 Tax=Scophthalmus maximus TaxID=52904 RepID=A0A6A4S4T6_SCOMX|nr:hypothetical protein F2P81_019939 [Scophthalmus maximus]